MTLCSLQRCPTGLTWLHTRLTAWQAQLPTGHLSCLGAFLQCTDCPATPTCPGFFSNLLKHKAYQSRDLEHLTEYTTVSSICICGVNKADKFSKAGVRIIHSQTFPEHLLCAGTSLGAERTVVSKADKFFPSWSSHPRTRADCTINKCKEGTPVARVAGGEGWGE